MDMLPNLNYQFWDMFHVCFHWSFLAFGTQDKNKKLCVKEAQVSAHSPCLDYGQGEPKPIWVP
jgi:hypothetical protein